MLRDNNNYVYFHDTLYKIIKKEFGLSDRIETIKKEELKIEMFIYKQIKLTIRQIEKKVEIDSSLVQLNNLLSYLYYKISFKFLSMGVKRYYLNLDEMSSQNNE